MPGKLRNSSSARMAPSIDLGYGTGGTLRLRPVLSQQPGGTRAESGYPFFPVQPTFKLLLLWVFEATPASG